LIVVLALPSTICACLLAASRTAFGLSRDGLFSRGAISVNSGGTPFNALLVSAMVGCLFLAAQTFERVTAMLSFFFVANYSLSFASVLVLRRREPDRPRPFRTRGYPVTTVIALAGSIAFLVGAIVNDPRDSGYTLIAIAASYPAYKFLRWYNRAER